MYTLDGYCSVGYVRLKHNICGLLLAAIKNCVINDTNTTVVCEVKIFIMPGLSFDP